MKQLPLSSNYHALFIVSEALHTSDLHMFCLLGLLKTICKSCAKIFPT